MWAELTGEGVVFVFEVWGETVTVALLIHSKSKGSVICDGGDWAKKHYTAVCRTTSKVTLDKEKSWYLEENGI